MIRSRTPRNRASLSPHAPYSTLPELLRLTAELRAQTKMARQHPRRRVASRNLKCSCTRAAKCTTGSQRNERDNSDCGLGSPVAHLARHKLLGENVLAIHVNCLARGDATLLGKNQTHVVHCPRSHDYFKHPPFLRERLANAGVNLCLGTDSLATTRKTGKQKPELNMFDEMRALAAATRRFRRRKFSAWRRSTARAPSGWPGKSANFPKMRSPI